jgi:FdrA protein
MQISRQAGELAGVTKVLALLGTDGNKKILADLGLMDETIRAATPNDLLICIEAETDEAARAAMDDVDSRLGKVSSGDSLKEEKPKSLEEAVGKLPSANFAMISLPGQFARLDVVTALELGLNVMLFSDNISLEDEVELKQRAIEKGLLLMGPDCGTAIINGVPLALANVVRRGDIGIAAASGTGIQEVSCLIDSFGGGISHAIGVGGRDLREAVGGVMMRQAIRTLAKDPNTKKLILLSKPGAPEVMQKVLAEAGASGLEVVSCLLGCDNDEYAREGMTLVSTLEEAAFAAMGREIPAMEVTATLRKRLAGLNPERKYLRGLYSGGTLCYETLFILGDEIDIHSNVAVRPELKLHFPARGTAHYCMDLGEDEFTQGRPHPIIDLGLRLEWLREEMANPEVKVLLLDLVLGYGANRDPGTELAGAIKECGRGLADGGPLVFVHVCGTDEDPQNANCQQALLYGAGVFLFPTNAQAARAALAALRNEL